MCGQEEEGAGGGHILAKCAGMGGQVCALFYRYDQIRGLVPKLYGDLFNLPL